MQFALDKNGNRVNINKALRSESYYCPCCGSKMVLRMGDIRVHHFAHSTDSICKDTWHYDMTEWHYEWQNRFPAKYQEVVKIKDGVKHRADILIEEKKVVIEFQHSPLSPDEFEDRNTFYNDLGYKVIWVFDVEEQYQNESINNYRSNLWEWKRPKRTFDYFNYKNKQVEIYLQMNNDDIYLEKVTWCTEDNGLSRFATDGYGYDDEAIVHMFDDDKIKREVTDCKLSELYDKLIALNTKDHTTYFYGCPISKTHKCAQHNIDIPDDMYSEIMPCSVCNYAVDSEDYENEPLICKKRFFDLKMDGNTMVHIEGKDKNGFISKISYFKNGTKEIIDLPTFTQDLYKDILTLWKENKCSIATFKNSKTGVYVRLNKDPQEMYYQYNRRVYGYISRDKFNFLNKSCEIYGVKDPVWTLEWFDTKDNNHPKKIIVNDDKNYDLCIDLYTLINAVNENYLVVYDYQDEIYYWIDIVDLMQKRFNAYKYNPKTKEKTSVHYNDEVQKHAKQKVWFIANE